MEKIIFHAHSDASHDSDAPLGAIISKAKSLGVTKLFLTDHNRLTSVHGDSKEIVIGCEEINALEGEIIGVFLQREIPSGLSLAETAYEIHAQGGLTVLPHPCDRLRSKVLPVDITENHIDLIDVIEVFNARTIFGGDNTAAAALAKKYSKPIIFGSDAHTLGEYGNVVIDNVDCSSPTAFLASLAQARGNVS